MFDYNEVLLSPEDASDMLNCGLNSIYKLLNSGKISAFRIGKRWKIPKRAVNEYILREAKMKSTGW